MSTSGHAALAIDTGSLERLKSQAGRDPRAALRAAATQFEAVFANMLLKSMREAVPQGDPLASDATRLYTGMLDQQLAQSLAGKGLGLADMVVKQLERHVGAKPPELASGAAGRTTPASPPVGAAPSDRAAAAPPPSAPAAAPSAPQYFIDSMAAHAAEAARATGIPARFALAQAALESGWGRREIRGADGATSFNVFGIKAGRGWAGRTVDVLTTEFVDGVAQKVVQKFRAYESYAEAFTDWARLLKGNPRYAQALAAGDDPARFAQSLQAAGYATDPAYAAKLTRVLNHALLRQSLV